MKNEIAVYGMTEADIREDYMESMTARYCGMDMVIAGILSDCQELLAFGAERNAERIRQQLNVAKFILFTTKETV